MSRDDMRPFLAGMPGGAALPVGPPDEFIVQKMRLMAERLHVDQQPDPARPYALEVGADVWRILMAGATPSAAGPVMPRSLAPLVGLPIHRRDNFAPGEWRLVDRHLVLVKAGLMVGGHMYVFDLDKMPDDYAELVRDLMSRDRDPDRLEALRRAAEGTLEVW